MTPTTSLASKAVQYFQCKESTLYGLSGWPPLATDCYCCWQTTVLLSFICVCAGELGMGFAKGVLSSFVDGVCWVVDMGCTSEQVPKPSTSDQRGSQENRLADKVLGVELPSGQKKLKLREQKGKR